MDEIKIPYKLPSANDYIKACRTNYHMANKLKQEVEQDIAIYLNVLTGLPTLFLTGMKLA